MTDKITYQYLCEQDIDSDEYRVFIEKFHGVGSYIERRRRMKWYWQLGNEGFLVLTAKRGDEYVGQSCAYRVSVCNLRKINDLWWGVDTFVLPEMRGQGVGKKLQGQLHSDVPNFSSAWYSPANGAIKRKCGGKGILSFPFAYYSVSSYLSILLELALKKVLGPKFSLPRVRLPWFYAVLNKPYRKQCIDYEVDEVQLTQLPIMSAFIENCLKDELFHVIRSEQYLHWKYVNNPRTHCRVLRIVKNGEQVGLIVFSDVKDQNVVHAKARVVKIYDSVFTKDSGLTHKKLLYFVADYCRKHHERMDVIKSLQKVNWYPALFYPKHKELLSTLDTDMLSSGYVTYMDQDMEG